MSIPDLNIKPQTALPEAPPPPSVKPWFSKTILVGAIIEAVSLIPHAQDFVRTHPQIALIVAGLVLQGLRLISKHRISLFED